MSANARAADKIIASFNAGRIKRSTAVNKLKKLGYTLG